MELKDYLPFWEQISEEERERLSAGAEIRRAKAGENVHDSGRECTGLLLLRSGQLRAYILSEEGREVTLYRLLERDLCLFSASCMIHSMQFEITVTAEKDTEFYLLPADLYQGLMQRSTAVANFTNEIMAARMSEVMWLMEQIMWTSFDKRLAGFLLEESSLEDSLALKITHETIARHLGTAREVVTRMLKYFQEEGAIELGRGCIHITDEGRLRRLSAG